MVLICINIYQYIKEIFTTRKLSDGTIYKATVYDMFFEKCFTFIFQLVIIKFGEKYKEMAKKITYN